MPLKKVFYVCLLAIVFSSISKAQNIGLAKNNSTNFRYLIAFDNVGKIDEDNKRLGRGLIVLIEKSAFTEENLKTLYGLLTKRFIDTNTLTVVVETDINQIPTPEERDSRNFNCSKKKATLGNYVSYQRPK